MAQILGFALAVMTLFDFASVSNEIKNISSDLINRNSEESLLALNQKRSELDYYNREALLQLERKFHDICTPLYEERSKILSSDVAFKGFWLKAMKNHPLISTVITEADEELLNSLVDIRLVYSEKSTGFRLDFIFIPNDFISNDVISKTYFLENVKEASFQDLLFDRTETTPIQWKQGKNLCQKEVTKTQRHKASGVMRTVTKSVDVESFFHFFDPMNSPNEEDVEEDVLASIEEDIRIDLEVGNVFKLSIIPRAYDWFTGKALTYEDFGSENEFEGMAFGEPSGTDDNEEFTADEDSENTCEGSRDNPQCKQQ